MSATTAVIIIAAIIVVAIVAWYAFRQRRTKMLRRRFGPEYDHAVREYGGQGKAEDALAARQKRMEKIHIRPLPPEERDRFADQWHGLQAHFVDDPSGSVQEADRLALDVMRARGYPMNDFERLAEDLSVDHPQVIRNYRAAHAIAVKREKGEATTEDLRKGLVYYRDLVEELLGVPVMAGSGEDRR